MVRNLRDIVKALRLHQDHLQLGGGVDVHNAASRPTAGIQTGVAGVSRLLSRGAAAGGPWRRGGLLFLYRLVIVIIVIFFVFIGIRLRQLLQFIQKSHVGVSS